MMRLMQAVKKEAETPVYYPVMCAWCREKGISKRVGWQVIPGSDGICDECREEMIRGYKKSIVKGRGTVKHEHDVGGR